MTSAEIVAVIKAHPEGLTSRQFCALVRATPYPSGEYQSLTSRLSKVHAYGWIGSRIDDTGTVVWIPALPVNITPFARAALRGLLEGKQPEIPAVTGSLVRAGYVRPTGPHHRTFKLTARGHRVASELSDADR